MSYIGSTPTTQSFIAGTDYFNGTGAQVAFTLSRSVNSVNDIEVIVNNVEQIPSGYSVSGTTLTFSAAPSAGTSNVYVRYLSTTNLSLAIPAGTSAAFNTLAYTGTLTGGTGVVNLGSGQVYKDASGNVGIGTSSPASKLEVSGSGTLELARFATTTDNTPSIGIYSNGSIRGKLRASSAETALLSQGATPLLLGTNDTERARIDSSGNLLVGTTDSGKGALTVGKAAPNSAYGQICALSPTAGDSNISGMSVVKYANDSTTAQVLIRFLMNQGGTGQGQINANGANTAAFGSYSDSRLKENIVDLPSQLDNIMALRPVEYDYIESMGGGHQIGFVAQEVQAIYPDLVAENEDGMLTLTDMNKNDARLIKCIQEQQTLITALTAQTLALAERLTALEIK